ncbi:MAG: asparagine synthase [Verrucomicrobia bacterium]|nr:asparagine synthase [Verrucomicrobiota bacterium]
MTVVAGKVAVQRYWKLEPPPELILGSDAEYEEAFSEVFTRAVHRRLENNNTTGAMLSGGIDSSSIVAIARQHNKDSNQAPLKTYSAILTGLEAESTDESSCIQTVIDQGDIDAYTITPQAFDAQSESYESVASLSDNPFDDAPLSEMVFQKASRQGDKSILTGVDGDLTTSISSRYLYYLLKQGKLIGALKESYQVGRLYSDYHWARSVLMDCLLPAYLPKRVWRKLRLKKITARQNHYLSESNLVDEFAAANCVRERIARMYDYDLPEEEYKTMMIRQAHILTAPWVTAALERYDSTAAKFGLECRHPFFDLDLVNFCLSLPWQQKTRKGWPKWVLRQAIGRHLPGTVTWRKSLDDNHESFNRKAYLVRVNQMPQDKLKRIDQILRTYLSTPENESQWNDSEVFMATWLQQHDPALQ